MTQKRDTVTKRRKVHNLTTTGWFQEAAAESVAKARAVIVGIAAASQFLHRWRRRLFARQQLCPPRRLLLAATRTRSRNCRVALRRLSTQTPERLLSQRRLAPRKRLLDTGVATPSLDCAATRWQPREPSPCARSRTATPGLGRDCGSCASETRTPAPTASCTRPESEQR